MKHTKLIDGRYELWVPDHIAEWDAAQGPWERTRFESMEKHLEPGMCLFDIGTEQGWQSAIYARFLGDDGHMCLFEPEPSAWPSIRATWEANDLKRPWACWRGLVGPNDSYGRVGDDYIEFQWPRVSEGDPIDRRAYRYLHDNQSDPVPVISIDEFVGHAGVKPDAITVDVEGAEIQVLISGLETLEKWKPMIWVSVHPDLMERDYNSKPTTLYAILAELGYECEYLGTDHEEHMRFYA